MSESYQMQTYHRDMDKKPRHKTTKQRDQYETRQQKQIETKEPGNYRMKTHNGIKARNHETKLQSTKQNSKNTVRPPTITSGPGYSINILFSKDLLESFNC